MNLMWIIVLIAGIGGALCGAGEWQTGVILIIFGNTLPLWIGR